ncbi:hypothetical protein MPH_12004 [Macrophomina phaseolina MS6]|uniref:Uncharacterized protein n=1 Tax=Macrophomina phaseolina (strain MS6) TaxID=1126212 RepID=K2QMB0_MACPH|nr:hypothetical protein MPH_12004 [Macrophomina phaseolina MS6]
MTLKIYMPLYRDWSVLNSPRFDEMGRRHVGCCDMWATAGSGFPPMASGRENRRTIPIMEICSQHMLHSALERRNTLVRIPRLGSSSANHPKVIFGKLQPLKTSIGSNAFLSHSRR